MEKYNMKKISLKITIHVDDLEQIEVSQLCEELEHILAYSETDFMIRYGDMITVEPLS